jgi:hypothetical protein
VKVVEKELTVVKQQAIESIENAAQQKINATFAVKLSEIDSVDGVSITSAVS